MKMAIYTQKCEQKWLRINNRAAGGRGVGGGWGWNKDVLGGKKSKINNRWGWGDDYSGLENIL